MEKFYLNHKREFEYELVSYLLRNNILKAIIYISSEELADRLSDYFSACSIPWKYYLDNEVLSKGYIISSVRVDRNSSGIPVINIVTNNRDKEYVADINIEVTSREDVNEIITNIDLDNVPMHLQNEEIRKMFLYSFLVADTEIDIISPWMNRSVINDEFLSLMGAALDRGVIIKIIYGLTPGSNEFNISRSRRSNQMADLMRNTFRDKSNQLIIKRDNIHYKLVLCDEKYKLEGGFNYLSFAGNYDITDQRREGSPFGRNIEEIKLLRKMYFEVQK